MSFTKLLRTAMVAASIITQGTLTAQTPGLSHTATWNNAGVTFIAQTLDVTDTASAAGSLLARWRVGGVTQFSVSKAGALNLAGGITATTASFTTGAFSGAVTFANNTSINIKLAGGTAKQFAAGTSGDSLIFGDASGWADIKLYAGGASYVAISTAGLLTAPSLASTGDFSVATNKFTVAAATGNTVIAGTLGVGNSITMTGSATAVVLKQTGGTVIGYLGNGLDLVGAPNLVTDLALLSAGAIKLFTVGSATAGLTIAATTQAATFASTVAVTGVAAVGGATLSATTALITPAGVAGVSSLRIPHGVAPTSPVDGDIWTTTAGIFVRVNGVTVGPLT
jgi:hypothetical protein